jgi:hypothetical protein
MEFRLEIIGQPPDLAGLKCEALICEGFVFKGRTVTNANVVHLCFAGVWHKLILDCGVIIWRRSEKAPERWAIPEEGWDYPHIDVGKAANVVGHHLEKYDMRATTSGCQVTFLFDNGPNVTIDDAQDQSGYQIN